MVAIIRDHLPAATLVSLGACLIGVIAIAWCTLSPARSGRRPEVNG
ncbi:hypothetical protein ACOZ4I_03590 [Haloarcula salina]